ncbi:MAG TPA: phosphatase PAP2 family protein [Gammaproteobacteria bacterium]
MPFRDKLRHYGGTLFALSSRLGLHPFQALLLLAVFCGGAWSFVELADDVTEGETRRIDTRLLLALRNPVDRADPIGPGWVEEMGRDFTALGGVGVLLFIVLVTIGYLLISRRLRTALFVAIAIVVGQLLSSLLKLGFDRPRPELVPHESIVYTASFPSGHSMMAAVTYLTLAALLSRLQLQRRVKIYLLLIALLITLLVGASRVYLGVHWPTDVLAGWMAGAAWAALWWLIVRWVQRRGTAESAKKN